jgi:predicted nucleic acid-binding protein
MYLDTSVIVKRYVAEPDSDAVDALVVGHSLMTSEIAVTEFWSALLAKERAGQISAAWRRRIWDVFVDEIESRVLTLVKVDGALLREANEVLLKVHPVVPLRSLDAIHLAAYGVSRAGPLFSADQRMVRAALALGFEVVELPVRAG